MAMSYTALIGTKSTTGSIRRWVNYSRLDAEQVVLEAQALIYQTLRVREMRAEFSDLSLAQGDSYKALPTGFLDPIAMYDATNNIPLKLRTEDWMVRRRVYESGSLIESIPSNYAIFDEKLQFEYAYESAATLKLVGFKTPAYLGGVATQVEINSFVRAISVSNSTFVDRTTALPNGATIAGIGLYSEVAASVKVKILKRNSAGNYDVVSDDAGSHPGTGWSDFTLASPYTVPASGSYYVGAYVPAGLNSFTGAVSRAYKTGDATGSSVTLTEDSSGATFPLRYTLSNVTTDTNFLTRRYPHLLRVACLTQAYDFMSNAAKYQTNLSMLSALIDKTNAESDLSYRGVNLEVEVE